ncbi:MAG: SRPBCC family protein [Thermoanaerobaculia bacterium]|nr:SRPBCC family protein [Thermoanaerobaculia bacterium]
MKLRHSIVLDGSLDEVWDLFVDPARWRQWNTEWAEIRDVRGPFDHPGAGYTQVLRVLGRDRLGEWRVVECEPKLWRRVGGRLPLGIRFRGRDEFRPLAQGTEVSLEIELDMPLGPLGRAAGRLFLPILRRQLRANAARAKAVLEQPRRGAQR